MSDFVQPTVITDTDVFANSSVDNLRYIITEFYNEHSNDYILVSYVNNKITSFEIKNTQLETPSLVCAGSFNPPHVQHITLMQQCVEHYNKTKETPGQIFELSVVNADKGKIEIHDVLTRLIYFTQTLGTSQEYVSDILVETPFFVVVTKVPLFIDKKTVLGDNAIFCVGIDTAERLIMPKYSKEISKYISENNITISKTDTGLKQAQEFFKDKEKEEKTKFFKNLLSIKFYVVGRKIGHKEVKITKKDDTYVFQNIDENTVELINYYVENIGETFEKNFELVDFVGGEDASSSIRTDPIFNKLRVKIQLYDKELDTISSLDDANTWDFKDFDKTSAWMKKNIFSKAGFQKIGIGFVGTGGGGNLFDFLFRSGSSSTMVFGDFEYHQNASYEYGKKYIDKHAVFNYEKLQLYKKEKDGKETIASVSSYLANALVLAAYDKLEQNNKQKNFEHLLSFSFTADYSNPRFCIAFKTKEGCKTFAVICNDEPRENVSNEIVKQILIILYNYINPNDTTNYELASRYYELTKPFLKFSNTKNPKETILLLDALVDTCYYFNEKTSTSTGGKSKKKSKRRNKSNKIK